MVKGNSPSKKDIQKGNLGHFIGIRTKTYSLPYE